MRRCPTSLVHRRPTRAHFLTWLSNFAFVHSGTAIPLSAKIGDAIQDYQDLVVEEKKEKVDPFVQAVLDGAVPSAPHGGGGEKKEGGGDRFNYSKWDNLDLSDDEKDFHPNIDNNLMIRLKREKREKMRAEEDAIIAKLKTEGTPEAEAEIERILEERKKRGLSGEDLCHDAWSHTAVNRGPSEFEKLQEEKKARQAKKASSQNMGDDSIEEDTYADFRDKYYSKMEEYAHLPPEKCEDFILEHPEVLQEEAAGHMLIHMLNLEMKGETAKMKEAARQYLMLQNILDLSKQSGKDPRAAVRPFFKEILQEEKMKQLNHETDVFATKIQKRAIDKKAEMEAEAEEEMVELSREERLGPGGLDPVEVFETLPECMQLAFESKKIEDLQKAVASLTDEEAKYHMKRCEDSGLWVPGGAAEQDDEPPEFSNLGVE